MIDQEVQRRMDAYRGNPQMLAQRYQQNQQLIDLLALQKLKSEKEAAARSLQMAATQGQGTPPTVAQQREQEVLGLTQQEVARGVGAAAQQRAAQERAAMQRLMGGIASAPGAENVMPENAMAAGGIVAFQEGGLSGTMAGFGTEQPTTARRLTDEEIKELSLSELQKYYRTGEIPSDLEQRKAPQIDRPPYPVRGPMRDSSTGVAAPEPKATPPTAAPVAAPAPSPAEPGIPSALPQDPARQDLMKLLMASAQPDREALMRQYQGLIPALNPERMAARQKAVSEAEARMGKDFDPKEQAMRELIAFLASAGGRTSAAGALGAGAAGAANYAAQTQAAQRARQKELEQMREGIRGLEEARELAQAQAGLKGFEAAEQGMRSAMPAAVSLAGAEMQAQVSRDNAEAQRALRAVEVAGRQAENELRREGLDVTRYVEMARDRDRLAADLFKSLKTDPKNFKLTDDQIAASVNARLRDFDARLRALGRKAGMGETAGAAPGVNLPSASAIAEELKRRGAQ